MILRGCVGMTVWSCVWQSPVWVFGRRKPRVSCRYLLRSVSARCCFLCLFACTSNKDEQRCGVLSTGGSQGWEMRFLELGLLPFACTCACLFTPLTGACAQGACVCPTSMHALSQMPAHRLLRKEAGGLWSLAVGHGRACIAQRQLRAAPLPLCPWHSLPCSWGGGEGPARSWTQARPALMASRTAMPRDRELGHGGLMLQLMSSYLGSSH